MFPSYGQMFEVNLVPLRLYMIENNSVGLFGCLNLNPVVVNVSGDKV